jgi:hypothetical protein
MRCPKERTLVVCSEGREVELFDLLAQLILERAEDGTLRKADAIRLLERLERLYYRLHEYVTSEDDIWL